MEKRYNMHNFFLSANVCFFLLFSGCSINAQGIKIKRQNVLSQCVFNGNSIRFESSVLSTFKARLSQQFGSHPVSTSSVPGLLVSFKYQINFNNEYSLLVGPEAIIDGRNFITTFNRKDFAPPLIKEYKISGMDSYMPVFLISFPLLFQRRILYSKTKLLFAEAGIRLNYSTGADFDNTSITLMNENNDFYNVGGLNVNANNDQKLWVSYPVNAGHTWLLKNNCLLQLAICSNISFTKYVDGTYQIDIPGKPLTTGRYSSTGSYIGLSMNYVFTNANYRLRKAYEKR